MKPRMDEFDEFTNRRVHVGFITYNVRINDIVNLGEFTNRRVHVGFISYN
jgi:hypothetical protein